MSPACKRRGRGRSVYWSLPPDSFLDLGVCGEREDVEAGTTIVQLTKPPTPTALEAEADAIGPGRGSEASFLGLS